MIETLAPLLRLSFDVKSFSDQKAQIPRLLSMLASIARYRKQTSVVLIDSYSTVAFWYTVLVSISCRICNLPYITILHGGNFPTRLQRNRRWSQMVFGGASAIISPSVYLQLEFQRSGYKVEYIPNSIDLDYFRYRRRSAVRLNLLWVRSFHKIYNPCMAVEVVKRLRDRFGDVRLCMVGARKDESWENVMDLIESYELGDNIILTGSLPRSSWTEIAKDYDIFINTTHFDNMPLSLIEAMALGLPIVSTNAGGIPFMVRDEEEALLVDKGNVEGMVNGIVRLFTDQFLAERLSSNGRQKAETFSWTLVQKQWAKLLETYEKLK